MTTSLDGKIAVVTGAASGIGLATLELFVEAGARVVAADIQKDIGRELEKKYPDAVCFAACDVMNLPELKAAIDKAMEHFGGLDILFNNAGRGGSSATVETFDAQEWDDTHALLLRAVVAGTSYAVPHMRKRNGGSIINTSSISALQAGFAPIAYSVAKAGVLHYTRVAASQLSVDRIRINAVVPGFIATNIFGNSLGVSPEESQMFANRVAENSGSANPLGRSGMPRDIAEAVLYLASDASSFVTGTHLTVDGGITIGPRYSWDPHQQSPILEAIGMTRETIEAMRANRKT